MTGSKSKMLAVIPLIIFSILVGRCGSLPVPQDYYSSQESPLLGAVSYTDADEEEFDPNVVIPKYDLISLKNDFENDPVVTGITSEVQTSLKNKDDHKCKIAKAAEDIQAANILAEPEVVMAIADLAVLAKMLDSNLQYMKVRKLQDARWPATLAQKVGGKIATQEEDAYFQQDLHQAVTGIVIMKMMEERVTFVNKFVKESLEGASAEKNLAALLGGSESVQVVEGLLALRYFEGFLHAANMMIEEALGVGEDGEGEGTALLPPFADIPTTTEAAAISPYLPALISDDQDDFDAGLGAFVILIFTAIGFFFVLFVIVYMALYAVRKCFDARNALDIPSEKKSKNNRSKYEQI